MAAPLRVGNFWAIAALLIAALALYGGSLRHPPVFDDGQLTGQFLRGYGSSWFKLDLRWFSYVTFGWTYGLFGGDRFWLRLGNVLLHAAVAGTLFVFLSRLFRYLIRMKDGQIDPAWYALFGALMFLAHPAAVYGVAYLMQRPILMATLFSLLSLAFFLEGLLRSSRAWLLASVLMYFIAVFSKEHCVMLPAVAAALALLVRGPSWQQLRSLAWLFGLYAAIAALVTLKAKGLLGAQYEPFAGGMDVGRCAHAIPGEQFRTGPYCRGRGLGCLRAGRAALARQRRAPGAGGVWASGSMAVPQLSLDEPAACGFARAARLAATALGDGLALRGNRCADPAFHRPAAQLFQRIQPLGRCGAQEQRCHGAAGGAQLPQPRRRAV
jgi:hypothetical protein